MNKDELMSLELTNEAKALINSLTSVANVQAGKYNFNNVDNLTLITQNECNEKKAIRAGYIQEFSDEYYNIIVTNATFLNESCINIKLPSSVAIKSDYGTEPNLYNQFKNPNKELQRQIRNFPTLVINKNADESSVTKTYAIVCKILTMKYESDGTISFTLVKVNDEPYNKDFLLANSSNLDIRSSKGVTELDEVHWAIKKVDLKSIFNLEGVI